MEYKFRSDIRPKDLWLLAMLRIYRGFQGVINIVFTVSVILMTVKLFGSANIFFRIIMIFLCLLFPVIQPLLIYGRCAKQLEVLPKDLELVINESGVHVFTGGKSEDIPWKRITNVLRQKNMIVIYTDDRHGYMISDRETGDKKEEFYSFAAQAIRRPASKTL